MTKKSWLVALALCVSAGTAVAQEVAQIPFFHAPEGSTALGAGFRFGQNPYFETDNEDTRQLDLVPLYLYEGRWLFARGTAVGVHFVKNDALQLNFLTSFRFQKLDPASNAFYEGMEKRQQSWDAGIEAGLTRNWGDIKLSWLTDTLDRHNGEEVRAAYRYTFESGPWSFSPFVSWTWQDDNLTNYYFGVSEAEATPDRPAYAPGETQWFGFGVNTSWQLTDRIVFFGNLGFAGADDKVVNSPLVEEAAFSQVFVGGTYNFGNVLRPKYIIDEERRGEWSWRVNYGYQADGNIVGDIDQGNFSKSSVADTNIAGFTVGKLLTDGPRVDFLGKLAAYRHMEEDEGNENFWSYAAYIMAMGSGYSPWSKQEVFRWGFGFGMSYAENIPIAEQRKQSGEGARGNTSHFINYLEMTLDFPLRRISKAKWLQSCYTGLTLVHRSGIFGTSDILGDVAGGADWVTAHLECKR